MPLLAAGMLCALGCRPSANLDPEPDSGVPGDETQALTNHLENSGFSVHSGKFQFFYIEDCIELPTCWGANPSSPYAFFGFPLTPGEEAMPLQLDSEGLARHWRLRADEAVLYIGLSPPEAKYFSYTPYIFTRTASDGSRREIFGSIADSINNIDLARLPGGPFEQKMVLLVTADLGTESRMEKLLSQFGLDASRIFRLRIPTLSMRLGLQPNADTFTVLFRAAVFSSAAAEENFLSHSPGAVLRVTPNGAAASPKPHPDPSFKSRLTLNVEAELASARDNIVQQIVAQNAAPGRQSSVISFSPFPADNGFQCLPSLANCLGDSRDAAYNFTATLTLADTANDFIYVVGALHEITGMASYSGIAVNDHARSAGITGAVGTELLHSADAYLPSSDPARGLLYVVKVARQCASDETHCISVPSEGWPSSPLGGEIRLVERAYLHPTLTVAPAPTLVLSPKAVRFTAGP